MKEKKGKTVLNGFIEIVNETNHKRATDLAEIGILSYFDCGVKYLLCVIDVFTKYVWVKPVKDKKARTIVNGFIEIVNEANHKLIKL